MCIATNWVTVDDCFVVGCRDDNVYCYKLGYCQWLLCSGLQRWHVLLQTGSLLATALSWLAEDGHYYELGHCQRLQWVAEMRMCTAMTCQSSVIRTQSFCVTAQGNFVQLLRWEKCNSFVHTWMPTYHPPREREIKKPQWIQYRVEKNSLGLENVCLQAEGCAIWVAVFFIYFFK